MGKARRIEPEEKTTTLFSVTGYPKWREWLDRYAKHMGRSMVSALEVAVREQAKRDGFDEKMPPRF